MWLAIGDAPNSLHREICGSVAQTPEIADQGRNVGRLATVRWSVPIAIVMAVPPVDHDLGAVPVIPTPVLVPIPVSLAYLGAVPVIPAPVLVPIPVSLAYPYPNAADPEIGALRDDNRFVDSDRGTGECRHGQEWNNT